MIEIGWILIRMQRKPEFKIGNLKSTGNLTSSYHVHKKPVLPLAIVLIKSNPIQSLGHHNDIVEAKGSFCGTFGTQKYHFYFRTFLHYWILGGNF